LTYTEPSGPTATPFAAGDDTSRLVTPCCVVRVMPPPTASRANSPYFVKSARSASRDASAV
jgi:hypothetical protein